ncbi:MAG: hypothetical protein HZC17_05525 [Candidatus Omnitrophica bacterium]|nr:hypothetical protein [Candidatus Omnitrophota bacterium]
MKKHQVFLFLLLLAGGLVFAPPVSFAIDSMPDYLKTLKAKIEVITRVPDKLERNTEYPVKARVTNTGNVPLPGIPLVDLAKGAPVLSVGWGFSKNSEEGFAFLGTYPADRPIQPGESRDFDMKFTVDRPDLKYFRINWNFFL